MVALSYIVSQIKDTIYECSHKFNHEGTIILIANADQVSMLCYGDESCKCLKLILYVDTAFEEQRKILECSGLYHKNMMST